MTTKSDIDQLLDTLESCGQSLPAHMVRQLLRMLARRCDEMEARLKSVVDQVAEESDREVLMTDMANEILADEAPDEPESGTGIPEWVLDACSDETKHLLANPRNAEALARSIKQAVAERQAIGIDGESIGFREKPNATTIAAMQEAKSIKQASSSPSRIMDNFHASVSRLYYAGYLSIETMHEFDELYKKARATAKAKREDEGSFW